MGSVKGRGNIFNPLGSVAYSRRSGGRLVEIANLRGDFENEHDLQELYRFIVDDFVSGFCQGLKKKDFIDKSESMSRKRKGRREYLNDAETRRMMRACEEYFESKVEIPLIRHGKTQKIDTLINEEALLLAKYFRNEIKSWIPRFTCAQ